MATILLLTLASGSPLDAFFRCQDTTNDPQGNWDAWLETPGGKLEFGMSIEKTGSGNWACFLVNGSERIKVPTTSFDGDVLTLDIAHYDSKLVFNFADKENLEGTWTKVRGKDNIATVVCKAKKEAEQNGSSQQVVAAAEFTGNWKVKFETSEDPAVGVFAVDKSGKATGTFLTTVGDLSLIHI